MSSPTKPTTNLTREDIRVAIYKFDLSRASSSLAAIAGEMNQDQVDAQYDKDIDRLMQLIDTYTQAKEREARIEQSYRCRELIEANANSPEDAEWYGDIALLDVDDLIDEINSEEPSGEAKFRIRVDKGFGVRCKKGIHLLELQGCIRCKKEAKERRARIK